MQQLTIALDDTIIEESSPAKSDNVHIEVHDDMHYIYRSMLRITQGYRHMCHAQRELALRIQTKHRLVVYINGIVEAQWSNNVLSGGQWIGCMGDTNYPYEAAWRSSRALSNAKQYFARYCIEEFEVETLQTVFPYPLENIR